MTWTSMKLATRSARLFGLDDDGKTRLHRTFRNFIVQGVLPTTLDEDDERGTRRFGDTEACAALLLLPMADMAVDARALREASAFMLRPDLDLDSGEPGVARTIPRQIDRAVQAVRDEKTVSLLMSLTWDFVTGKAARTQRFEIEGEDDGEDEVVSRVRAVQNASRVSLANLRVPASVLLKPFLLDLAREA